MHASKQYLAEVRKEYERAGERDRSGLLDKADMGVEGTGFPAPQAPNTTTPAMRPFAVHAS
ncbi:MAG: hypothetical protein ACJ746_04705, partial [Bryobacteraceae bacterium]